jgi:tetratricopeptide (TPR) repeat protein
MRFPTVLLLLGVAACARSSSDRAAAASAPGGLPPGHPSIGSTALVLAPAAQALLDSGNVLFRAGKHAEALALYRAAASSAPAHAAPWYGVSMAARALGDSALADSAMMLVRARTPDLSAHPVMPVVPPAPHATTSKSPKAGSPG